MADKKMLMPAEIAEYTIEAGIKKANTPNKKVLASAFLAGAYIAFGALGSVGAAYNLLANPDTYGLGKMVCRSDVPCRSDACTNSRCRLIYR